MGMRASIAMTGVDGLTRITSVQWSTRLDQTIGNYLAQAKAEEVELPEALTELLNEVLSHGHISALEMIAGDEGGYKPIALGRNTFISFAQEDGSTPAEMTREQVREYHLDGGSIGAHYDQRRPNLLEFFWYDEATAEIAHSELTLYALARSYAEALSEPKSLRKFRGLTR